MNEPSKGRKAVPGGVWRLGRLTKRAAWGLAAVAGLFVAAAAFRTEPPPLAHSGSPLYQFAVKESIEGLKPGAKPKKPTLPAGQVCPYCGQIHPLTVKATGTNQPLPLAAYRHPITNRWAVDYFYCYNCKIYHHRKPQLHPVSQTPIVPPATRHRDAVTSAPPATRSEPR